MNKLKNKTITKEYRITNWVEFTECPVGNVKGMEKEIIHSVMGNHPVKITSWWADDGTGFERREFTVEDIK